MTVAEQVISVFTGVRVTLMMKNWEKLKNLNKMSLKKLKMTNRNHQKKFNQQEAEEKQKNLIKIIQDYKANK